LRVRVAPPLRAEIERAADADRRTVSDMIRLVLLQWAANRVAVREQVSA
jgi:hypothetical protein